MKIYNELLGYQNRNLYQDTKMFSFTLDSVLVARFLKLNAKTKKIVDFGTNNAVIPLIVSKYTKAQIVGVEIQQAAANLAQENVKLNQLENQIVIVCADLKDYAHHHRHEFDAVVCNPPFFKLEGSPKFKEVSEAVVHARHEVLITLEEIIASGAAILKNGGSFTIVHRAERIDELIQLFLKYQIQPKRLRFVYSKEQQNAKTVLLDGILNGNWGMQILPPLIGHHADESYTDELLSFFHD